MTNRIRHLLVLVAAACAASCAVESTPPPPMTGPSEMALSLALSANPDVLSVDGSSQSLITIEARDHNGQPAPNVPLRIEILANGQIVDYGSISARTLVTGSNGRATLTYTAPPLVGGEIPQLELAVTPTGVGDAANQFRRVLTIRLVQPGTIPGIPTARFTASPLTPQAFTNVRFDATASTPGIGAALVSYVWDFGDNTSGTGVVASHQYSGAGTYHAVLTVTDSSGVSAQSAPQAITVGAGDAPTSLFVFSPTTPTVSQNVFFNGTLSTPGQGHRIVRYDWDFGTGSRRSGSTVTRSYDVAGTYNVVLTVTDEAGQTGQSSQTLTVTSGGAGQGPTALFTFSPTQPVVNQTVFFNGTASTPGAAGSITSYSWNFGDGATATGSTPSHAFAVAGTYVVRLTITNSDGQTATRTETVVVGGTPGSAASFSISPINPRIGTMVNFDGSGSTAPAGATITNYAWDFGDGTTGSGVNAQHAYAAAFTYTVRLTVTDSAGRTATTTLPLTVVP